MRERLKTAVAAKRLRCHPKTLIAWVKEGLVNAECFRGRTPQGDRYEFDPGELDAFDAVRWEKVEPSAKKLEKTVGRSGPK